MCNCKKQDDPQRPFIPSVRGLILPPPTSHSTRRARAASFSAWTAAPLEASDERLVRARDTIDSEHKRHGPHPQLTQPDDGKSSVNKTVRFRDFSRQRRPECVRSLSNKDDAPQGSLTTDSDKEDADSQQDFEEIRNFADSIDFDNSQLISFEMLTPPSGLRGGKIEIRTLRPVRTVQNREDSPLSIKHQQRISQSTSCQVSNLPTAAGPPLPCDPFSSPDRSWSMILPRTIFEPEPAVDAGAAGETRSPQPPLDTRQGGITSPVTSRRTVANRHARLIDGAIFTVKHRGLIDPSSHQGDSPCDSDGKRSVVRASWSAVRQKDPRHSLIQGVRGIFRKDQQTQPQQQNIADHKKGHRRTSSLLHNALDRGCDMLSPRPTVANTTADSALSPQVRNQSWGLDGTFDEEPGSPRSTVNLDKALPASPGMPAIRNASSSCTTTPLFEHSDGTPVRPSTASSVSSGISAASSKRDFRSLTRGLINEDMNARRQDLSPVREIETLSSKKYDPRESVPSSFYS